MADILKPKRGKHSTLADINPILQEGEIVFEKPDDGSTSYGIIKMGDGHTDYNHLKPFIAAVTDYISIGEKGKAGGIAPLNNLGMVPIEMLPNSLDDVLEFPKFSEFPETGETGKIYIDTSKQSNNVYRWSGTQYVCVSASVTYTLEKEGSSVVLKGSDGSKTTVSNVGGVEIRDTEPGQSELYEGKMWIVK